MQSAIFWEKIPFDLKVNQTANIENLKVIWVIF